MQNQDNEQKLIGDILAEDEDNNDSLFNSLKLDSEDIKRLSTRAQTAPPIGVFTSFSNNDMQQEQENDKQYSYLGSKKQQNEMQAQVTAQSNNKPKSPIKQTNKSEHSFNLGAQEFVPSQPIAQTQPMYFGQSNVFVMPPNHLIQPPIIPTQIIPSIAPNNMQNIPGIAQASIPGYSPWAQYYTAPGYMEGELTIPRRPPDLTELKGQIVEASKDQHGSRLIQYRFENASLAEKKMVFDEVLPKCLQLMNDVFGNYVVQKLLEFGTEEMKRAICEQLIGNVVIMGKEIYGCRVVQKALEVANEDIKNQFVQEIKGNVLPLVEDQNGNHVIQKCVEHLPPQKLKFIVSIFKFKTLQYALHPFGCRVLQRMLERMPKEMLTDLMAEVIPSTFMLAQDQYGNYVIQHLLEFGLPEQKSQVINFIRGHVIILSTHKYASNVLERCLMYGTMEQRNNIIEEMLIPVNETFEENPLLTLSKDRYGNYVVQRAIKLSTGRLKSKLIEKILEQESILRNFTYGKYQIQVNTYCLVLKR